MRYLEYTDTEKSQGTSKEAADTEDLLERFRYRMEEETKSLVNIGIPRGKVEEILMYRLCTSDQEECRPNEDEICRVVVKGRMRMEEAKRALTLDHEIKKLVAKGLRMDAAMKEMLGRLGTPRPSAMDELQRVQGVENDSLHAKLSKSKTKSDFESLREQELTPKLRHIIKPLSERSSAQKFSGKTNAGTHKQSSQSATSTSRKRNIGLLRAQPCVDFKKKAPLKINILRRKKQKQKQM
mmetsp:Transcript_18907/g.26610  ORF Transcript_18907/g.26610 Transcript_18907/m.26610 type:complete len:239 (+) Transcript_18907:113-829(+)|eukprot:CAMPEP_0185263922 /NCGR_PEP_ID=MMETSP1359-20130426/16968_1 /TAXON_ID=552665 /ORGANISM="Bigelowiella longifila, Strain CCMP242" /LENGTH=238 /DNA_ID=CAMNT_0027851821 /DNA_START=112 /DNA_END=828 /DNA_ORIENTATION=+